MTTDQCSTESGKEDLTLPTQQTNISLKEWKKIRDELYSEAPLNRVQLIILERLRPIGTSVTIEKFVQEQVGEQPLTAPYMNRLICEFESLHDRGYLHRYFSGFPRFALTRKGWYRRMVYCRGKYA